ncbi:putative toxin-antitoxin system toxin component, PIN family [Polynucleobacter asymbioticus]|nr:putative toxin-antitoxin system toxin component, PIN family [Polynucleobacter asymbioticus]
MSKSVIFDTNVLLDLFVFHDVKALHLKAALLDKKVTSYANQQTLDEFADVIARPLFALDAATQSSILTQWQGIALMMNDAQIQKAPWLCQDPDDQVFLDLAYSLRPCILLSKDLELLKIAPRAAKEDILITSDYTVWN